MDRRICMHRDVPSRVNVCVCVCVVHYMHAYLFNYTKTCRCPLSPDSTRLDSPRLRSPRLKWRSLGLTNGALSRRMPQNHPSHTHSHTHTNSDMSVKTTDTLIRLVGLTFSAAGKCSAKRIRSTHQPSLVRALLFSPPAVPAPTPVSIHFIQMSQAQKRPHGRQKMCCPSEKCNN